MKKLKRIIFAFALIISTVLITGCANIEYIRAIDASNTIVDKLVIELNESKIDKAGSNLNAVMSAIDSDMVSFRNSVGDWKLQFSAYPDLFLAMDNGIIVEVTKSKKNQISLTIQFSNWDMFGLFYGYSELDDFEYYAVMKDVGPFVDKILEQDYGQENYALFLIKYSILKNAGVVEDLETFEHGGINYYEKYKAMLHNRYDINDVKVAEIFAYPDDRLYSNADEKQIEANMTLLRWELNNKSDNFEMEIYKVYPNSVSWYVLALIVSAIVVVAVMITIYKKNKGKPIQIITKKEVENDKR